MDKIESRQDYLERILMLSENGQKVRAIDIATSMNYSKPSVSIALKKLKNDGHIEVDSLGYITLTTKGKEIALATYEKHKMITAILMMLGVNEEIAKEDACKIEHDLSDETFLKIKEFLERKR